MGFVFGIPGATIYSYRGLPIRESGKIKKRFGAARNRLLVLWFRQRTFIRYTIRKQPPGGSDDTKSTLVILAM